MNKIFLIVILIFSVQILNADNVVSLKKAKNLYDSEKYEEAVSEYSKILANNYESADLYYNTGNCYYRLANYPEAIYYYEKANLLAPDDADIQHNLALANRQIYDKIQPMPKAAILRMYENFMHRFSCGFWSIFSFVSFSLMLLGAALFLFGKEKSRKVAGFAGGSLFLIFALIGFIFSQKAYQRTVNPDAAIVFAEAVSVKSAPDADATDLFIIHEGLKVEIDEHSSNWIEIKLADGRVGWVRRDVVRML